MSNPVIDTAKNKNREIYEVLSTGIKAKILPVSVSLIQEVSSKIKNPEVPNWFNEDKQKNEPNPLDPKYIREMEDAAAKRGQASIDAMIMFGVELLEDIPNDNGWVKKLKYVGIEFDSEDQFEREFYYKKYIAVGNQDLMLISRKAGINQEAVNEASKMFPGN